MKIDYAKITDRAVLRRSILEQLEDKLKYAKQMEAALVDMLDWASDLSNLYREVDAEGRSLLPPEVDAALCGLPNTIRNLREALNLKMGNPNALTMGITFLVQSEEEE